MRKLIFLMLVSILMACAASTEQLAKEGDWYEIGYQDGVRGQAQRPFKELAS